MAKYWFVFRLVWIEQMAYRVNFFLEVLSGMLSSLIVVFLWMAIYRAAPRPLIGEYSLAEMVTYLLGAGLINSFILTTAENQETSQSIREGTLSGLLIQPLNPYWIWFIRDLGRKAFLLLLGLAGYLVVFLFFRRHLIFRASLMQLGLFAICLMLGALLQFLLFEAMNLLAFWLENTYGIRFVTRVIMEVAGGAIIPLSFFPAALEKLFLALPFSYLIYLPMRVYLGKIAPGEMLLQLAREIGWIAALAVINWVAWSRGVRQYVSMGD